MSANPNSLIEFTKNYTVIDLETTGFSYKYDKIIEIAAVKVRDGNIVDTFVSLINPERPIPSNVQNITGISSDDVVGKPIINQIIDDYINFIGDDIVLGHNVSFDIGFINANTARVFDNKYIDTLRFSRKLNSELKSHTLELLTNHYNIVAEHHRALADCESTNTLYAKMLEQIESTIGYDEFKALFKKKTYARKNYSKKVNASDIIPEFDEFDENNFFYGKAVCFTGKLEKYTRAEAMQLIANLGGTPLNGVTSKTNVLVVGDMDYSSAIDGNITSKHKKATDLLQKGQDIIVISESDFMQLI